MNADLPLTVAIVAAFVFCIVVHEVAHALVAHWLGDDTAKNLGRITLNPIPHVDPIMSILLPAILAYAGLPIFGGAKPVPVNMFNFRHPFFYTCLTALAGPVSNVLLAVVFGLVLNVEHLLESSSPAVAEGVGRFATSLLVANVVLTCFNMIPIPPLDGSRILAAILPRRWGWWIYTYPFQALGMLFIVVLVFSGETNFLLKPVSILKAAIIQVTKLA
jgi:Zn-dependent protease